MSTYTDLKNTLKETLNVDYKTRATNLEVAFINKNNRFYGTFEGEVTGKIANLSGSTIRDSLIENSVLSNVTLIGPNGKIELGNITNEVQALSNAIHGPDGAFELIDDERTARMKNDEYLSSEIKYLSSLTSSVISSYHDFELKTIANINYLSDLISTEVKNRITSDEELSNYLSIDYCKKIANEASIRQRIDEENFTTLSNAISTETLNRIKSDEDLSNYLSTLTDNEKHYKIVTSQKTGAEYPIKSSEFAVNVLTQLKIIDGYVVDADKPSNKIAQVLYFDAISKTINIKVLSNIDDFYKRALPIDEYTFVGDLTIQIIATGYNFKSTWTIDGRCVLELDPIERYFYNLIWEATKTAGIVTSPYAIDGSLISGYVTVTSEDSEIAPFRCNYAPFNGVGSVITYDKDPTIKIVYQGNNVFHFCSNVSRYEKVIDKDDLPETMFGKVYELDVVKKNDVIKNFLIKLLDHELKVFLSEPDFKANVDENDNKISCSSEFEIDYYNEKRKYSYKLHTTKTLDKASYVKLTEYNKQISDDFTSDIDADISSVFLERYPEFKDLQFTLKHDLFTNTWNTVKTADNGNTISVTFDKSIVRMEIFDGQSINPEVCPIYKDNAIIYQDDTIHHNVSKPLTFVFNQYSPSEPAKTSKVIALLGESTLPEMTFDVNVGSGVDTAITILVNNKKYNEISREMLFVIRPTGVGDFVDLKFVREDGYPIQFFYERQLTCRIPVNKYTTLKLQEIYQDKFLLIDLDQNSQEEKIEDLYKKLSSETSARISVDTELSNAISANSEEISAIWKNIRGNLVYRGTMDLCCDGYISGDMKLKFEPTNILSNMFGNNFAVKMQSTDRDLICGVPLRAGFYYVAKAPEGQHLTVGGLEIENNDWIVIDDNCYVSSTTSSNVNILDAQDDDSFRLSSDNVINGHNIYYKKQEFFDLSAKDATINNLTISGLLSVDNIGVQGLSAYTANISSLSSKNVDILDKLNVSSGKLYLNDKEKYLSNIIEGIDLSVQALSTRLSNAELSIDGLSNDINSLSNRLSNDIDSLSSRLSNDIDSLSIRLSTEVSCKYLHLSSEISSNDNDISTISNDLYIAPNKLGQPGLSGKVDYLLSVGHLAMTYNGSLTKYGKGYKLIDFLSANFGANYFFKQGFMIRLSAKQDFYEEGSSTPIYQFNANDYFIFNKDCKTETATSADIDVIYDSVIETSALLSDLTTLICCISSLINNDISSLSSRLSTDINSLSTRLSNDIDSLSIRLSTEVSCKYLHLSSEISSNDNDISYLSSELSDYHNTLSGIDRTEHGITCNIATDNLMITDMNDPIHGGEHARYYMTMLSGTLVLKKI